MGSITVLAGDPGLGKSLLSLDLAALLSRGELGPRSAGDVLLLTAEDSRTHTVRPRLEAAGADLARVHFGGPAAIGSRPRSPCPTTSTRCVS